MYRTGADRDGVGAELLVVAQPKSWTYIDSRGMPKDGGVGQLLCCTFRAVQFDARIVLFQGASSFGMGGIHPLLVYECL